jgi:DUF1365 family protein
LPAQGAIYEGWVMHRRLRPRAHRFKYRVFSLLLEPAALPRLRLLTHNRWGLFSFHDTDHGDGRPLDDWLNDVLAAAGVTADGKRQVLCYPRILGFVFNPLSVWFCHDPGGTLRAIIHEVHNTYDERHAYVLPVEETGALVRQGCPKAFYVSPFLSPDCRYHFRITPPGESVAVAINESEAGKPILIASFAGRRRALTDGALVLMLLRYPLMTVKVFAAIHFEAVRLMLKGVRRHGHVPKASYPRPAE